MPGSSPIVTHTSRGARRQREYSCAALRSTACPANTGGKDTCTIVATSPLVSPSTFVSGLTRMPAVPSWGARTWKAVVAVV